VTIKFLSWEAPEQDQLTEEEATTEEVATTQDEPVEGAIAEMTAEDYVESLAGLINQSLVDTDPTKAEIMQILSTLKPKEVKLSQAVERFGTEKELPEEYLTHQDFLMKFDEEIWKTLRLLMVASDEIIPPKLVKQLKQQQKMVKSYRTSMEWYHPWYCAFGSLFGLFLSSLDTRPIAVLLGGLSAYHLQEKYDVLADGAIWLELVDEVLESIESWNQLVGHDLPRFVAFEDEELNSTQLQVIDE